MSGTFGSEDSQNFLNVEGMACVSAVYVAESIEQADPRQLWMVLLEFVVLLKDAFRLYECVSQGHYVVDWHVYLVEVVQVVEGCGCPILLLVFFSGSVIIGLEFLCENELAEVVQTLQRDSLKVMAWITKFNAL